jgi:hypothetical protein
VRRAAIADALDRAREYAAAVGARLDRLIEIADEGAGGGGMPLMRQAFGMAASADASAVELDVDPQPQTVSASVLVRFAMTEPTVLKGTPGE